MSRWLGCCLGAVIFWGVWGLVFSAASTTVSPLVVLVLSTVGLLPVLIVQLFSKDLWKGNHRGRGVAWGVATGLLGALGNVAFSMAIVQGGEASIITPLTAMFPLVTLILAAVFLRERMNFVQCIGIVVALVAILLFDGAGSALEADAWSENLAAPWLLSALICLVLFGIQGITQKLSTNHISDQLSTICYCVGSGLVAVVVLVTQQLDWSMSPGTWGLGLGTGVVMALALWVGFAAYRGGSATIVTALIALYPVVTVLLAIPLLGDSMNGVKAAAIVLALLAGLALTYTRSAGGGAPAPIAEVALQSE